MNMEKRDVFREWRESAPYWAKHAGIVREMFAPITSAIIDAAALQEDDFILDLAGGSGEPTITIAETTSPASIVFTDAVAEMVRVSRDRARARQLTGIEFAQCVGEALPFASETFDVIVCRLGVMLFPDPVAALHEIVRVAKPGGRIALAVWGERDANPFFHVVADLVSHYIESPPEDPEAPGAFHFATSGKLAGLLNDCGAVDVTERILDFSLEAPLTPRQFWEVRTELSDTLRAKVAQLSPEQVKRLAQEVEQAGRAFVEGGRMRFPAKVLIVSAVA
jgi:SAM-dependent methyltransferase